MKETCDRCGARFADLDMRYACAKECTFCERCSTELDGRCPNCRGALERTSG